MHRDVDKGDPTFESLVFFRNFDLRNVQLHQDLVARADAADILEGDVAGDSHAVSIDHINDRVPFANGFAAAFVNFGDQTSDGRFDHVGLQQFARFIAFAAGDVVLIEVGRRLKQLTRQGDMVLRWGGEEFLIVLRNLNQTALTNFTNRALQVIGSEPVIYQNVSIQVTASAGFLTLPFAGVDEHQLNWEKALKLADMALYMGKVHGRNRGYGLVALHRPYEELRAQLETDLSMPIEQGHLEITLVLGPPQA